MQKKMGRPRLEKSAKDILIGARFSPAESKQVHAAIKRSKKEKSQWIRTALLSAATNPELTHHVKIKLTVSELEELQKTPVRAARDGGFQNFLVQLQYRIDEDSGELELDNEDISRIRRYAFDYRNGGWQNRLIKIFSRTLGDNLAGCE